MPLWHNSKLNLEYRKDWEQKGYHILNDLLTDDGKLLMKEEMKEKNLKIHFLDYIKMDKSVKKVFEGNNEYKKISGPHLPKILSEIGLLNKGCSRIYNILMTYNGNVIKDVKEKWERTLNEEVGYTIIRP